MSAYSFVSHRMFVAALGNNAGTPARPAEASGAGPVRAAVKQSAGSILRPRISGSSLPGVLLASAMLHGFQANAS